MLFCIIIIIWVLASAGWKSHGGKNKTKTKLGSGVNELKLPQLLNMRRCLIQDLASLKQSSSPLQFQYPTVQAVVIKSDQLFNCRTLGEWIIINMDFFFVLVWFSLSLQRNKK